MSIVPRSYNKIHKTLRRTRGPASIHTCPCGESAKEWAYQYTGEPELRDDDGNFPHSADPNDYVAMCRPCHRSLVDENDPVTEEERKKRRSRPDAWTPANRITLICCECELVSTPSGMSLHQRSSGHTEVYDVC